MKAILVNEDKSLRWDNVPDPIQKAEKAHDILYKGQNVGKVVLTVE